MIDEDNHPSRGCQIAGLIDKEVSTKVSIKYTNFIFSQDLAFKLLKHTGISDYAIKLVNANKFIRPFKLPADILIFFGQKSDRSFLVVC